VTVPRAEIALVGALLIDPDAADAVAAVVDVDDFASVRWRAVYAAATSLRQRGMVVNYVTLCDELERRGHLASIGEANLTAAINCCPCSVYALDYARGVARAARERLARTRVGYALPARGGIVA